jgi:hypothetical protein
MHRYVILRFGTNLTPVVSRYPKSIHWPTPAGPLDLHVAISQQTPKKQLLPLFRIAS